MSFRALVLRQQDQGVSATLETLTDHDLPKGEVLVKVDYSSINYKDGLAVLHKGKVVHHYPMVPGIDFAGQVLESQDDRYHEGDAVIMTGWGVGEKHWGGFAEKARVFADWLVPLPQGLTTQKAMIIGTAGLTAMLCVNTLIEQGIGPDSGEILVTGASGGVGSVAVMLLSKLGFSVAALTGRQKENGDWLLALGAKQLIKREDFEQPAKPLERAQWAGVVDVVGGTVLSKALSQVQYGGVATLCGLAGSSALSTTVMPFILRGVSVIGIDSVNCPYEKRLSAWGRLAEALPEQFYQQVAQVITLDQVPAFAESLLQGQVKGRVLVKL